MTRRQIQLIQASLEQLLPIADTAAALFYGRLFEIDPSLRPLFTGDMQAQGRELMHTLTVVVRGLKTLNDVIPVGQALVRRNAGWGMHDDDYVVVAEAWRWTMRIGLGEGFTPEVEEAWLAAYTLLTRTMQTATHPAGVAAVAPADTRKQFSGGATC